ncbi:alpha/beta hydrolase [Dactylosporangium salmoneum]|uniref:Alpha/beta hydrolase n=1 Tax=Dactylosporangium salmoneum TaxID=53361 RepID=A0ABP5TRG2_9ACTN
MANHRDTVSFDVEGGPLTAITAGPAHAGGKPLVAAVHGGTYTAEYFDVDGSGSGTFMDVFSAAGYPVVSFNRPGYGGSLVLEPAENTFPRHALLLADAIGQAARRASTDRVFLVGHSIGGMISLMITAGELDFRLVGASVTGMGAVIRADGAAHALASLPEEATVDLPYDQRDQVMFGPPHTYTEVGVKAAHEAYAPTPVRDLVQAPRWADEHLPGLAPRVRVPVHNALAEFDALWDSTPANVGKFAGMLTNAPVVNAGIARDTGHSLDHHILGHALFLRQLAFAEECMLWHRQELSR